MEQQQKSCVLIPDAADIDRLSELHKAMGDFTRMKILWALMGREYCVNELATQMNMSESAVSHQLKILKFAKLEKCILRFMRRTYQVDFRRNLRPYL